MTEQPRRAAFVVRRKDLPKYLGLNRTQIDLLISKGEFPAGALVSDGGRARIWTENEILAWQQTRFSKRDAAK
jgi:predicted DNA-binding transcriptional regulator AlpA